MDQGQRLLATLLCQRSLLTRRALLAMGLLLATLLLTIAAPVTLQAQTGGLGGALSQQTGDFLPVEQAYQLEVERTGPQQLRLYWQITDGYYLYQHRFKVKLEDAGGTVGTDIQFPEALLRNDEFFGDVQVYYHQADLKVFTERSFETATLTVTSQGCADAGLCYPPYTETFELTGSNEPAVATIPTSNDAGINGSSQGTLGLLAALGFALLGGVILNAMPCVFPILSLKVLSFATGDPTEHRRHAWWYLLGVVSSFVGVAAVLAALQSAGQLIGWGFQLQSPGFVIGLAYLFTAMALSLSGLVHFGGGIMNLGQSLAGQGGIRGSFFTGVLAVVVASPCTAPFMGSALGFALTQPTHIAALVFTALGVGMAAPMVMLSYSATARNALPKPGPWMERLKELMAFPLYLTAVWLLWVAGKQAGLDAMTAALAGLVLLALGLYLYRGALWQRLLAMTIIVAAVALATVRGDTPETESARAPGTVPYSAQALSGLRSEGVPVFVDVTADWCITCLANEQAVLFTESTRKAFEAAGVVYMVADWTDYDADIGEFVQSHGRNGIPLYVMYPADSNKQPFLLPQLLTSSIIHEALAKVSPNENNLEHDTQ